MTAWISSYLFLLTFWRWLPKNTRQFKFAGRTQGSKRHLPKQAVYLLTPKNVRVVLTEKKKNENKTKLTDRTNSPKKLSTSSWTFCWMTGWRPRRYKAHVIAAAVVSWPWEKRNKFRVRSVTSQKKRLRSKCPSLGSPDNHRAQQSCCLHSRSNFWSFCR